MTQPRLHSAYNPQKEASRFVSGITETCNSPQCIVLLGAGAGYIYQELKKKYNTKIIRIFYSRDIIDNYNVQTKETDWHPGHNLSLREFLYKTIEDTQIPSVMTVEWPASARIWKQQATSLKNIFLQFIRERTGTMLTSMASGRHWLNNIIRNLLFTEHTASIETWPAELVILASGPSLRYSLTAVKKTSHITIALPSSLCALKHHKISPALAISTDGNYYAKMHLWHLSPTTNLISPLVAAIPAATYKKTSVIPIIQTTALELPLKKLLPYPTLSLPPHGTVAGTAIQLAILQKSTKIHIAGLDMAAYDIHTHTQPHSFDAIWQQNTSRKNPYLSKKLTYSIETTEKIPGTLWRKNKALTTYAEWFSQNPIPQNTEITRINPSPIAIKNFKTSTNLPEPDHEEKIKIKAEKTPPLAQRKEIIKKYLTEIQEKAREALTEKSQTELGLTIGGQQYYQALKNNDTSKKTIKEYKESIDKYIKEQIEKYNLQ